jgi:hypothetical protein
LSSGARWYAHRGESPWMGTSARGEKSYRGDERARWGKGQGQPEGRSLLRLERDRRRYHTRRDECCRGCQNQRHGGTGW